MECCWRPKVCKSSRITGQIFDLRERMGPRAGYGQTFKQNDGLRGAAAREKHDWTDSGLAGKITVITGYYGPSSNNGVRGSGTTHWLRNASWDLISKPTQVLFIVNYIYLRVRNT